MPTALTTCTACGCTCDDIRLSVDKAGLVTTAENACELGAAWFAQTPATGSPVATIDGQPATLNQAIARAAELLVAARLPLVAGLQHATTEAIRAAVALADQVGGCIDWTTSVADAASTLALQTAGGVTATLGEVAQRADVVLLFASDLATTHPRHFERYSLEPTSQWIASRAERTLLVIEDHATDSMQLAEQSLLIKPRSHFESLVVLRAIASGIDLDAEQVLAQTGVALDQWQQLASRMQAANYGAVVYGKAAATTEVIVAINELMAQLTATTRWVAIGEGGPGNATGAANVCAWQTGYPLGVSLAERYPQYGPGEYTAEALLSRGEADAALVVADDLAARVSTAAAAHLRSIPTIAVDWRDTPTMQAATVAIYSARPAVECGGTTYRVDGIALPMRPARTTDRPTAEAVLQGIKYQVSMVKVVVEP